MFKVAILVIFLSGYCLANPFKVFFKDPKCVVIKNTTCPNQNVTFWLYTNKTRETPKQLDPLNLKKEDFKAGQALYIILHGYKGHRDYRPNPSLRPALLNAENASVISVDYGPLVQDSCYFSGVKNLPIVSRCIAQLINTMVDQDVVQNDRIHMIGFSLGAHLAGQTANHLKRPLKRITGLDPATPWFTFVGRNRRLDKTDAEFVDVIHTDVFRSGKLNALGHVDFYPNFGLNQPGCSNEEIGGIRCSHHRAYKYYAESIGKGGKGFYGYSWINYWFGGNPYNQMGHHVNQSAYGKFFLKTASSPPFGLGKTY